MKRVMEAGSVGTGTVSELTAEPATGAAGRKQRCLPMADAKDESHTDRRCTNCGMSVDDKPYRFWLFHTCPSCSADAEPRRWGDAGTYRKWRYFPRWHMTRHPDLPDHVRARWEATA